MRKELNRREIDDRYVIPDAQVDESITKRLEVLGVNEGASVSISSKEGSGSVIIKVRETHLALGKCLSKDTTIRGKQTSRADMQGQIV